MPAFEEQPVTLDSRTRMMRVLGAARRTVVAFCHAWLAVSFAAEALSSGILALGALAGLWVYLLYVYVSRARAFNEFSYAARLCKQLAVLGKMASMEPKIFEVSVEGVGNVYKGADQDEASDAYVGYTSDPTYADAHICMYEDGEVVEERLANETDFSDVEEE